MWNVRGYELQMTEGDYGVQLPVTIRGATFSAEDSVRLTIKATRNGRTILTKNYSNITENTFYLELTESETAMLPVGAYVYAIDWYQSGVFMDNIIPAAAFKVVDKA